LTVTAVVVIVNAGDTVVPPATVTEAGTVVLGSLLVSVTTAPPAGAGPFSVTVFAVVEVPPSTDAGDNVTVEAVSGPTVKVAIAVAPYVAEIVTGVAELTELVVMVNAGDTVVPAATVTEAGTVAAAGLLLISVTTAPPAGAGPLSVTVFNVVDVPPSTDVGDRFTAAGLGASTVKVPGTVAPPYVAVIVTGVLVATAVVVMANAGDTVAAPATVTVAGTVAAAGLPLVSVTTAPPFGAGPLSVTVFIVVDVPPRTDPGDNVTAETMGGVVTLFTVTDTPALVLELFAESVAMALSICGPLVAVVVSQLKLYPGPAPVTTLPRLAPSNWNCTPVSDTISTALAVTVTVPLSIAPAAGAVTATDNGVASTVNSSITSSELL